MKEIIKPFFNSSISSKVSNEKGLSVYKDLVLHRFYELFSNSFPMFFEIIEEDEFLEVIHKFMQYGAKDLFIWKTPKEFMKFVKREKLFKTKPYIYDLLLFEWVEIELMMKNYKRQKQLSFSWDNKYVKPKNVMLFKTKYNLIEKNFTKKEEQFILAYFDLISLEVTYMPVHEAFYLFFKTINKTKTLEEHLKVFAKKFDLELNEVKEFLEDGLKSIL